MEGKDGQDEGWSRGVIERLAFSAVTEQRRARRWSIFFKVLLAFYLLALLLLYMPRDWDEVTAAGKKHTALVELSGAISDTSEASADSVIGGLRDAFEDKKTAGVILRANSPGGSPVQSSYIYQEIRRLRELHPDKKLYAVITDMCASGCYYVVSAADEIYVNKSSIVGSIGVRMDSFGFVDTLDKLGIERRLYTAGENKGFLDPFLPSKEADIDHIQKLLGDIHEQFKSAVRDGRGDRLQDLPELFTGLVWTGEEGIDMGLVDKIGSAGYVAREVIGEEEIVDFTQEPDLLERLSDRIGVAMARAMGQLMVQGSGSIH
ncbi:MAG TPA: S49 family peptidase [Gammaproteobacteria bacterium]|jgi:protease-4|nr:S49 family peptidase [Gammaproteobacteria bacterium]